MDRSIPPVTVIQFSKWKIVWFVAMVLVAIAGLISLIQGGSILKYIMAVICVLIGGALAVLAYRDLRRINKPQLSIGSGGIQCYGDGLYPWEMISNEKIVRQGSFKPTYFLSFDALGGNRRIHLDGLNKRPDQIMELIRQYRALNKL